MTEDLTKFESRSPGVPAVQDDGPNAAIMLALQKGTDPAIIEKLMDLAERQEANIARKDHFDAVARFKAEAPKVKKDKYNSWLKCHYTSLGNLLDTYNPCLAKHGLSISFLPPEQDETSMTVECRLSHSGGHVESVRMKGPIDTAAIGKQSGKASRNPMQDIRSTFTYLRSTTCEAILGVSGTEATADDDGNAAGPPEPITENQIADINTVVFDLMKDEKIKDDADFANRLSRLYEVNKVEDLNQEQAKALMTKLGQIK